MKVHESNSNKNHKAFKKISEWKLLHPKVKSKALERAEHIEPLIPIAIGIEP